MADGNGAHILEWELIWGGFVTGAERWEAVWTSLCVIAEFKYGEQRERFHQGAKGKRSSRRKVQENEAETIKCNPRPRGAVEKALMENALGIV